MPNGHSLKFIFSQNLLIINILCILYNLESIFIIKFVINLLDLAEVAFVIANYSF